MLFAGGVNTTFGANSAEGAVFSTDYVQIRIPGFRTLSGRGTGRQYIYSRWHPQMDIFTQEWIASPFPQTIVRNGITSVDRVNADGTYTEVQPLIFTLVAPLHLQSEDSDSDRVIREHLVFVSSALTEGHQSALANVRIAQLSDLLQGNRPQDSAFQHFNMVHGLNSSMLHYFDNVMRMQSPLLGTGSTIATEFRIIYDMLREDRFPQHMIDTIMYTLILTSINDYAFVQNNPGQTRQGHWWNNLPYLESQRWFRTARSHEEEFHLMAYTFSPLSMLTIPNTSAQRGGDGVWRYSIDDLQFVGGAAVMLYNYIQGRSGHMLHYLPVETIKSFLFVNNRWDDSRGRILNPYRNLNRRSLAHSERINQYRMVWGGWNSFANSHGGEFRELSDSEQLMWATEVYNLLLEYGNWTGRWRGDGSEGHFFFAFLHNSRLAFRLDVSDSLSMFYDGALFPDSFSTHRLLGNGSFRDGIYNMLYGTDPLVVNARGAMQQARANGEWYHYALATFMTHILDVDLSQMSIQSITALDDGGGSGRRHHFMFPLMLDGNVMARGINQFLETTTDRPILAQQLIQLAWWNFDGSRNPHAMNASSEITAHTMNFLPTVNRDTPIHVVGMTVSPNRQFSDIFLQSFVLGDGVHVSNSYFAGYHFSSPAFLRGSANLLRDVWGGQNLAAFNNNPQGGRVTLREEPTEEFLAWLSARQQVYAIQNTHSMSYAEFMGSVPTGLPSED